jgi:DMSO/TMAO reductase YedYZ heme-binding membrane subunit
MKTKQIITLTLGIIFLVAYIILANSVSNTQYPWLMTRAFGLMAILLLFASVFIRELKYIGLDFFCRQHCKLGILTFYFALLHLISAVCDKFMWGTNLTLLDYLGTNYSDKWMILLSLGAIAFYLIIFVGFTSSSKTITKIGFGRWKLIHYMSYVSIALVFVHSILLGTDLSHSELRTIIYPAAVFLFAYVTLLLLIRVLGARCSCGEERATVLVIVFLCAILIAYSANEMRLHGEYVSAQDKEITNLHNEVNQLLDEKDNLSQKISELESAINNLEIKIGTYKK